MRQFYRIKRCKNRLLCGFGADENDGRALVVLAGRVVADDFGKVGVVDLKRGRFAEDGDGNVARIDEHAGDAECFLDLLADTVGIFGVENAVIDIFLIGNVIVDQTVDSLDLVSADLIEDAFFAEQLGHGGAGGGKKDTRKTAEHNDQLHFIRRSRTGTRGGDADEFAQKLRPEAGVNILAVYDPLLTEGYDLLADGDKIPLLHVGQGKFLDHFHVIVADIDKARLDRVTLVGHAVYGAL